MLFNVAIILCNTVSTAQTDAITVPPNLDSEISLKILMYADANQVMPSRVKLEPCSQGESFVCECAWSSCATCCHSLTMTVPLQCSSYVP